VRVSSCPVSQASDRRHDIRALSYSTITVSSESLIARSDFRADILFHVLLNDDMKVLTSAGLLLMFSGGHHTSLVSFTLPTIPIFKRVVKRNIDSTS
jgi:hypothetical protein